MNRLVSALLEAGEDVDVYHVASPADAERFLSKGVDPSGSAVWGGKFHLTDRPGTKAILSTWRGDGVILRVRVPRTWLAPSKTIVLGVDPKGKDVRAMETWTKRALGPERFSRV